MGGGIPWAWSESATYLVGIMLNSTKVCSYWWFYPRVCFLKLPRAANPKTNKQTKKQKQNKTKNRCVWFPLGVCHAFGSPLLKEIFKNSSLLQVLCQHAKGRHCTPASPSPPVTQHQWGRKALRGNSERMSLMIISHLKNLAELGCSVSEGKKLQNLGKSELQDTPAT